MKRGHCYCFKKNKRDGIWFRFDDHFVEQVSEDVVKSESSNVYLILCSTKQKPNPPKEPPTKSPTQSPTKSSAKSPAKSPAKAPAKKKDKKKVLILPSLQSPVKTSHLKMQVHHHTSAKNAKTIIHQKTLACQNSTRLAVTFVHMKIARLLVQYQEFVTRKDAMSCCTMSVDISLRLLMIQHGPVQ